MPSGVNCICNYRFVKRKARDFFRRMPKPGGRSATSRGPRLAHEEPCFEAGLHHNFIGGIERRERTVSVVHIGKVAKALGVRPGDQGTRVRP